MDWADYLRDEAAKYRQLAETAEDVSIKQELLDLAAVCEEAANNIEDRMPGGLTWRWRRRAVCRCDIDEYTISRSSAQKTGDVDFRRDAASPKHVDDAVFC
jgi:hypothetical protein